MTEGGLVVFGGLFGGVLTWLLYCRFHRLSLLQVGDVIAPGMLIGLAFGRIGCLMNGCCFGGDCEIPRLGVTFPAGSPAYNRQLETGELLGLTYASGLADAKPDGPRVVQSVQPGSLAEKHGMAVGDRIDQIGIPQDIWFRAIKRDSLKVTDPVCANILFSRVGRVPVVIPISELPDRSNPIHPTQIYSSINAFILALLLWFYYPFRRADGELMAWLLVLYPVARFLLEQIRTDELGVFGTSLSISQWVSILVFPIGLALLIYLRTGVRRARPVTVSSMAA